MLPTCSILELMRAVRAGGGPEYTATMIRDEAEN